MKKVLFILCLSASILQAQDIILKTNGEEILSKVVEVEQDKIRYKRHDYQDGPTYSIATSELFMIRYANGSKDVFTNTDPVKIAPVSIPIHPIEGQWQNKLVPGEPFVITNEGLQYYMQINGTKARLISTQANTYMMDGVSFQLTALSADSIVLKDVEQPGALSMYLVRNVPQAQAQVTKVAERPESKIGGGISTGVGSSYGFAGLNAELRLGPRDFCLRPNVGIGVYSPLEDGSMPWSVGAKLYFGSWYLGYRYGYLGSALEEYGYYDPWTGDYYYGTYYYEAFGSVLQFGWDLNFGKQDQIYLTFNGGLNISGIELDINLSNVEVGFGFRI